MCRKVGLKGRSTGSCIVLIAYHDIAAKTVGRVVARAKTRADSVPAPSEGPEGPEEN